MLSRTTREPYVHKENVAVVIMNAIWWVIVYYVILGF